jgi:hypothetical protein
MMRVRAVALQTRLHRKENGEVLMRHIAAALAAGLFACVAQAQMFEIEPVDPKALACLANPAPVPRYPAADEGTQRTGFVRLSLKFTAPDQAPEVQVLFRNASDAMLGVVDAYARSYRLPCMAAGASPVLAVQEYDLKAGLAEPAQLTPPRVVVTSDEPVRSTNDCIRRPGDAPPHLQDMVKKGDVSNALFEANFPAVDAEPDVKVLYSSVGKAQLRALTEYVRQHRLSCIPGGGKFAIVRWNFRYEVSDAGSTTTKFKFKEAVPLTTFLRGIKGIQAIRTDFDLSSMSCPFQVAWTLGKPALDNRVAEVGKRDLNRTEFLAWLAGLEMSASESLFERLVGETIVVNVPCGRLALTPQG